MNRYAIILAAGKGTRMKSEAGMPKSAFPILKTPLVQYVINALKPLGVEEIVGVVGHSGEIVADILEGQAEVVWQKEQLGTGHAIMQAAPILKGKKGSTIVCCGDTPLLTSQTLGKLLQKHEDSGNDLTILTAVNENPKGYGRIILKEGQVIAIREQKDCTPEEAKIQTINAGVYVFDNEKLFDNLGKLSNENAAHEYYLTDMVAVFNELGYKVGNLDADNFEETLGVNDRRQLAEAAAIIRKRINDALMVSGVSIEDPNTTYIGPDVAIGPDTVICPNTHIYGKCTIGKGNEIGPDCYFNNVTIGDGNVIVSSNLADTEIGNGTDLGPYLRTRKGVRILDKAHIGNFNELKNVVFGEGSKCAHLSYLGDSEIGDKVNIGCGTIIANYDGVNKFRSKIDDGAFIGSGTILISPVHVGEEGFTAAGSTITEDVPGKAMAIARGRQVNKDGYAEVFHEAALRKKEGK